MPSHIEKMRARARLDQTPAPVDDDSLRQVGEEAAAIVRQAQAQHGPRSTELLASAVDDVSRNYYQYLMRRRHRGHRSPDGDA